MTTSRPRVWIHPSFQNDSKLRVRERYWREFRHFDDDGLATQAPVEAFIIPDAATWRMYLPLIRSIIESRDSSPVSWFLLESVAEFMDHRNQSPCIPATNQDGETRLVREPYSSQERIILQRLVRERNEFNTFCDVSVRKEEDEWEVLDYANMTLESRSGVSLLRAGHLLQERSGEKDPMNIPGVWYVCETAGGNSLHLTKEETESGMKYISMEDLLQWMFEQKHIIASELDTFTRVMERCREAYNKRIVELSSPRAKETTESTAYTSEKGIQQGLREGKLERGRLNVTKENPKEAFVLAGSSKFYIDGVVGHFGQAIHQDSVVVELLPERDWGRPVGRRRIVYQNNNDTEDEETSSGLDADLSIPPIPSARVVAVERAGRRIVVATMTDLPSADDTTILVIPMDVRIPKIRIRTRAWQKFLNVRLKVEIDGWDAGSKYPSGHCVDILGPVGDLETEVSALLLENQVLLDPFSVAARACLPAVGEKWQVSEADALQRKDLRESRRVFSVDPPGCQDIDDTMHAEVLPNGDIEVGVHIADVTHFVKHNSALDKEAQLRGTTFYLVDRRFDMLPSLLSANLCSLHEGIDRLAVSVIWTLSRDFKEVKSCWYGRTVIHNCAAMTYDQADNILADKDPEDPGSPLPPPLTAGSPVNSKLIKRLKEDLSILTRLARKLKKDRENIGGAVDLSSGDIGNELKFALDENGNPTRVLPKKDKEIHHTIAEMMIMANTAVATKIYQSHPATALLRVHRAVQEERFEDLKEVLTAKGVKLNGTSNMDLATSLKVAQERVKSNAVVNSLFRSLATRAMTEARYICTGDTSEGTDTSHYGLGLEKYTHFTSPIRRYADVVVHKQLLATLTAQKGPTRSPKEDTTVFTNQKPLQSLPDSTVVSILGGEGLEKEPPLVDDLVDDLTTDTTKLAIDDAESNSETVETTAESAVLVEDFEPHSPSQVKSICERLNLHNRLAKQSSFECQSLFLSLYFRDNVEVAEAVVTNIRLNGFWVYLPKFDMRAPVYVRDIHGSIQIDPALVGLPQTAGLEPTVGFSFTPKTRRFPDGSCKLLESPEERLDVVIPDGKNAFTVKPLDVVTVTIACDKWDVRARVPSPRLYLSSKITSVPRSASGKPEISSSSLRARNNSPPSPSAKVSRTLDSPSSVADVLSRFSLSPTLPGVPFRSTLSSSSSRKADFDETIKGRRVFGGFCNPDTRSAAQEAAQLAAAAEATRRREQLQAASSRRNEYDTSRVIERDVTMRQQRLAASKRNTRRSKAK